MESIRVPVGAGILDLGDVPGRQSGAQEIAAHEGAEVQLGVAGAGGTKRVIRHIAESRAQGVDDRPVHLIGRGSDVGTDYSDDGRASTLR